MLQLTTMHTVHKAGEYVYFVLHFYFTYLGSPSKQRPPTSEFVGAGLETLQTDELTVQQIHFSPSMPSLSDYKAGMCQDKVQ